MKYDWAGRALKLLTEHHEGMKRSLSILMKKEITEDPLDPLFAEENQPMMRSVWEELAELAASKIKDPVSSPHRPYKVLNAFKQACFDYYYDCRDSLRLYGKTEAERRKELEEIARLAEELRHRLAESELAWTSVLYYVREDLEGTVYPDGVSIPRIEELLIDLATEAKEAASRPHKHQLPIELMKKNGVIPKKTFRRAFVLQLSAHTRKRYGKACNNLVANTATVIFDIDTPESYVKSTWRNLGAKYAEKIGLT